LSVCHLTPPKLLDIFCVFLSESLNVLDSQLDPADSTRRDAQTGILRFTIEIIVYKWLPLVIWEMISKN